MQEPATAFLILLLTLRSIHGNCQNTMRLVKNHGLKEGQMLYIEKKKKKNKEAGTHTVKAGESMYFISQLYGIQLKQLYKMNKMKEGDEAPAGNVLELK